MGYLGSTATLDLNILIRTITVDGGAIEFRTGAGIVADSSPRGGARGDPRQGARPAARARERRADAAGAWSTVSRRVPSRPTTAACSTATVCSRPWRSGTGGSVRFPLHMARLDGGVRAGSVSRCRRRSCSRTSACGCSRGSAAGSSSSSSPADPGPRGYRPPREPTVTRVVMASARRVAPAARRHRGARLRHATRAEPDAWRASST